MERENRTKGLEKNKMVRRIPLVRDPDHPHTHPPTQTHTQATCTYQTIDKSKVVSIALRSTYMTFPSMNREAIQFEYAENAKKR